MEIYDICDKCKLCWRECSTEAAVKALQSGECQDFKPKTNADHIRSMSDEELVEHIECPYGMQCPVGHGTCGDCILEWLKQPYKEDTDG